MLNNRSHTQCPGDPPCSGLLIRDAQGDLPVKPARTPQGGIQGVWPVGCPYHQHMGAGLTAQVWKQCHTYKPEILTLQVLIY